MQSRDPIRLARLELLRGLYAAETAKSENSYLSHHADERFLRGTEQVFDWYRARLGPLDDKRILDWGCRHAPDACLLALEGASHIEGCDVVEATDYADFHQASGLIYSKLTHPFQLPYADASFDVVIGSGVLEHVPMPYESIRELSRVCRDDATLVITYLPNSWSVHEMRARRAATDRTAAGDAHHLRTYRLHRVRDLLMSVGFVPVEIGYQTHFDLLPLPAEPTPRTAVLSAVGRRLGAAMIAPCIAVVAAKRSYL
jgi:2-polyprenyl-3-methyl-5-hydroxy-6-metoxy-1,4-benzoquinol methylase